jgi:uncharacterized protein (DUF1778 family)
MTTLEQKHDARLGFRLSRTQKQTIERAAFLSGQSISDFAASSLLKLAEEVIDRQELRVLSNRDRDIFLAMLDADQEPNPALKAAAEDYKRAKAEGRWVSR